MSRLLPARHAAGASRAGAVAAVVLLGGLAGPAAGQVPDGIFLEPFPRAAGVSTPRRAAVTLGATTLAVGVPDADVFGVRAAAAAPRVGTFPLLVIPAAFADSEDPPITSAEMQRLMFDGPGPRGTLSAFYEEASQGRFRVAGTVAPWVRTSVSIRDAAGEREGHGWIGAQMRAYVADAIRLADEHIDYGRFDNDGPDGIPNSGDDDGFVDGLAIKYGEVSGACGGPAPWPHFGAARTPANQVIETAERTPAGAPIRVQVYIADSVMDCTGLAADGIEVLAHEFGHLIGLPDLYTRFDGDERENRAWTAGCFDLMAAGAWGCGTGPKVPNFGPTHFSPLMKERLGWITFTDVEAADRQEFVLPPAQTATTALRVRLAPNGAEWFILEYRPRSGFDLDLPAAGVLVYHYDALGRQRPVPAGMPRSYDYHLVEADGDFALRRSEAAGGNRGAATDVFAADGTVARLDATTSPSTRDHAGAATTLTIHSIVVAGGVARVTLSVGGGPHVVSHALPTPTPALAPLEGQLVLGGGTPPYAATVVAGGLPAGLATRVEQDIVRITGAPLQAGRFAATLVVRDAAGREASELLTLVVDDVGLATRDLLAGLTGGLDERVRGYLDLSGNGDGTYDVGDLRAYLLRTNRLR